SDPLFPGWCQIQKSFAPPGAKALKPHRYFSILYLKHDLVSNAATQAKLYGRFALSPHPALARSFFHVRRFIRPMHQLMPSRCVLRKGRHADTRRQLDGTPFGKQKVMLVDPATKPGCQSISRFHSNARQEDDKLVATHATRDITGPNRGADDIGDLGQDRIPCLVAVRVVDPLKVVEIDKQK